MGTGLKGDSKDIAWKNIKLGFCMGTPTITCGHHVHQTAMAPKGCTDIGVFSRLATLPLGGLQGRPHHHLGGVIRHVFLEDP
jgi:hypothetical protein